MLNKALAFTCVALFALTASSHQTSASSLELVQNKDTIHLKMGASLAALKDEILNAGHTYKSKKEFEQKVVQHITKHLVIRVNEKVQTLTFRKMTLAHASTIYFDIAASESVKSLSVENKTFQRTHRSRARLKVELEGQVARTFTLEKKNAFKAAL